ncbi:MAG TPA: DUF2188 domain-containing protein [Pyrinomonadaceae bacterium]|nr:DUF2188 domain-containing protein [Pyrinomonadaceae bacterium]
MRDEGSKGKVKKKLGKTARKAREPIALHVVPRIDGWVVRIEGNSRATSSHSSQREAIEVARTLAKRTAGRLIIHGSDGRIIRRNSYTPDPFPPRQPRKVLYPSSRPNTNREAIRKAVSEAVRESAKS